MKNTTPHMVSGLAALLSCGLAACATQPDPFDALPSYDGDTGGGKFDDPNCTEASYKAFIKDYLASKVKPDANPCPNGNDASYRLWAYAVHLQLEPMDDRYTQAILQRASGGSSAQAVAAAGTLDDATRATLQKLLLVKPKNAGKVGLGAWNEYLYDPAVSSATAGVGSLATGLDQRPREITSYEAEWLGYVEQVKPNVVEPGSWEIWWSTADSSFSDVRTDVLAGDAQKAIDQAWLGHLAAAMPATTFDEDGAAFQGEITQATADDYTSSAPQVALWQQALAFKPKAGGTLSYKAWASTFVGVAEVFNDGSHSDAQSKLLDTIIAARPCASGTDVDALVARVKTGLASAGTDGAGKALADDAVPVACAAPMP